MGNKKTASFSMRMEPKKKRRMEEFFEELGLTLAYGVSIFFEQCIIQAGLPFEAELSEDEKTVFDIITGPKTAQLLVRIDPYKKSQVEYTFGELGITPSEAVDTYFRKCLCEWGVPFRVGYPKPNAETLAAMAETADESKAYTSLEEMFRDLESENDQEDTQEATWN